MHRQVVLGVALLFALPVVLFGQSITADILGTVHDASGATVANAAVTVRSLETNAAKEATTGPEGTFRFALLPIGSYEVTVVKIGFARYVQQPIVLRLNQAAELTINLQVSGTT